MFRKLLKYDLVQSGKLNFMIFAIALGAALLGLSFFAITVLVLEEAIFSVFIGILLIALVFVMPILILIFTSIYIFNSSYGSPAYLTRMFPVKPTSLYNSKVLTMLIWVLSALVFSLALAFAFVGIISLNDPDALRIISSIFDIDSTGFGNLPLATRLIVQCGFIPYLLLLLFSAVMLPIFCIVGAQGPRFRKTGFGGVLLMFAILYGILQVINFLAIVFPWQLSLNENGYFVFVLSEMWGGVREGLGSPSEGFPIFTLLIPLASIPAYFWCRYKFTTEINLR